MARWSDRKESEKSDCVINKILSGQSDIIKANRDYVTKLIEVTLFLGKQGISYRAHRENEESLNKGIIK